MAAQHKPARLVLHFDVNETIMVGDPAGGDTPEESANKMICKSSFVKPAPPQNSDSPVQRPRGIINGEEHELVWYDGSEIFGNANPPPLHFDWDWPADSAPTYRACRGAGQSFTEPGKMGEAYRHIFDKIQEAQRWEGTLGGGEEASDARLRTEDGRHFLLPAFFRTLAVLAERGRKFTVVIRTFGDDVEDVAAALSAFAEGKHQKTFGPGISALSVSADQIWHGRYHRDSGVYQLTRGSGEVVEDEEEVVRTLEASGEPVSVVACTDDYHWWSQHKNHPSAGKPVWITRDARGAGHHHHIFFDDNIHHIEDDSIVAVRARDSANQQFSPLTGSETISCHGQHLIRTPTVEPVLNQYWFLEQIDAAEAALEKLL